MNSGDGTRATFCFSLKSDEPGVDTHASRRLEVVAEVTSNE